MQVTIAPGEAVWLCTCGQSANYPFCDGTHKKVNAAEGTTFKPQAVKNEGDAPLEKWVCTCGHSKSPEGLFCDGTHRKVHFQG